jgi:hypothetical protein
MNKAETTQQAIRERQNVIKVLLAPAYDPVEIILWLSKGA